MQVKNSPQGLDSSSYLARWPVSDQVLWKVWQKYTIKTNLIPDPVWTVYSDKWYEDTRDLSMDPSRLCVNTWDFDSQWSLTHYMHKHLWGGRWLLLLLSHLQLEWNIPAGCEPGCRKYMGVCVLPCLAYLLMRKHHYCVWWQDYMTVTTGFVWHCACGYTSVWICRPVCIHLCVDLSVWKHPSASWVGWVSLP